MVLSGFRILEAFIIKTDLDNALKLLYRFKKNL